jgi:hypothetical protein
LACADEPFPLIEPFAHPVAIEPLLLPELLLPELEHAESTVATAAIPAIPAANRLRLRFMWSSFG